MTAYTHPLQVLLVTLAGWVNRHQQRGIEYLAEEDRVLREQPGGKVPRLTDDQRRRLAARGKILIRRALEQVATIVTMDTIMRWHKRLIAAKWTYARSRVGRPGIMKEVRELVVRFAAIRLRATTLSGRWLPEPNAGANYSPFRRVPRGSWSA